MIIDHSVEGCLEEIANNLYKINQNLSNIELMLEGNIDKLNLIMEEK